MESNSKVSMYVLKSQIVSAFANCRHRRALGVVGALLIANKMARNKKGALFKREAQHD